MPLPQPTIDLLSAACVGLWSAIVVSPAALIASTWRALKPSAEKDCARRPEQEGVAAACTSATEHPSSKLMVSTLRDESAGQSSGVTIGSDLFEV